MKIQIKSWINASVLFECEADLMKLAVELAVSKKTELQGAYLQGADLQGAYLQGADLRGADLQGADLQGAYLQGADLRGADLQGADLQGADLRGEKLEKSPFMMQGMKWDILISKQQIMIGCQWHKAEEWFKFKDKEISNMHSEALVWWKANKKFIKSAWELHCKD